MDRRLVAIRKIEFAFAFIVARVKLSNKLNFIDINIVAEDFFKTLLNLIYEYDLKNSNAVRQNESAIDLFYNKEKIAYQITSQNKSTKISKTVDL
ncbi:MAG TPA: SMEK domain-containing protein, partial [Bacteroidia bacterium]|nr:SMEK domain-containing protein [Bacteroidia bacterium]